MPKDQITVVIFVDSCEHTTEWNEFTIDQAKDYMCYDDEAACLGQGEEIEIKQIDSGIITINVPDGSSYIFVARPD